MIMDNLQLGFRIMARKLTLLKRFLVCEFAKLCAVRDSRYRTVYKWCLPGT